MIFSRRYQCNPRSVTISTLRTQKFLKFDERSAHVKQGATFIQINK